MLCTTQQSDNAPAVARAAQWVHSLVSCRSSIKIALLVVSRHTRAARRAGTARRVSFAGRASSMLTLWLSAWLVLFALQAGAVASALAGALVLADLESDLLNPHDCARRANLAARVELALGGAALGVSAITGRWLPLCALLVAPLLLARDRRQASFAPSVLFAAAQVDATDVYALLQAHKMRRALRLTAHMVAFVIITVRLVQASLDTLLTIEAS